jgi:hypothetical protein
MIEFFKNIWNSGVGNKIFLIAGALIFLGALAGVIWVIVRVIRKENDAGFAKTSYGKSLYWKISDLPLSVFFDPSYPDTYERAARDAAKQINEFIGRDVFGPMARWMIEKKMDEVDDLPHATMYLGLYDPDEHKGGSNTYQYDPKTGEMDACYIKITSGMDGDMLLTTTRHEMGGHGLGLAHDHELQGSVMYPTADGRAKDFTKEDKKRLCARYGGKDDSTDSG